MDSSAPAADALFPSFAAFAAITAASLSGILATGRRAGMTIMRMGMADASEDAAAPPKLARLSADIAGYNLSATTEFWAPAQPKTSLLAFEFPSGNDREMSCCFRTICSGLTWFVACNDPSCARQWVSHPRVGLRYQCVGIGLDSEAHIDYENELFICVMSWVARLSR